ncbi:TNF receptor-associated factor 3 isoform X1 [Rhipicephalus sanguineus]|uniref:TNF receptor-associated factor 3 isoform X1 n=1 Tax=Rhipicephalus sanguineus TaxID=34632 RepID=UPI0020C1E9A1|nr:TNF receptor-associated factor 3 isoform X1 [Rhipicephalus sanguineus]
MAPEVHSHAVYGFSESLDWTTLHFVKLIDDIRVCSACRAVARKTAFLACRHVLCEPCYEHWKSRGSHVCFLDGDLCPENEVYWMEFPAEKMMKSEVSCWNRENGCEIIADVSSITDHFHRDCEHHSACCPKCSSTVLRKDIIAHLESQCASHVLRIKSTTPPSQAELKDMTGIWEGVRGVESALRNASHNDALLHNSLQGVTAKNEENGDSLSKMAVEVAQMSQVTKQTLSAVERSSKGHANQTADLTTCKESLCSKLDEIERAADELRRCESAAQQDMSQCEKYAENLHELKTEMQSMSSMLRELRNILPEAAVAASAAADGLSEVLSSELSSYWSGPRSFDRFPLEATARVFENALKLPVKVLWCVHGWPVLVHKIEENNLDVAATNVTVDGRYQISLHIRPNSDNDWLRIAVTVLQHDGTTLGAFPRTMALFFTNSKSFVVQNEMNFIHLPLWRRGRQFPYVYLSLKDVKRSGIFSCDVLKVHCAFFY